MNLNRRQFLGTASAAAFPFIFPGCTGLNVRKYAANEKVNVGVIGAPTNESSRNGAGLFAA